MPKLSPFFGVLPIKQETKGKQRAVPHIINNWATHVYAKVNLEAEKPGLLKNLDGLEEIDEQHISLSRAIFFKEHQLEPFARNIRQSISSIKRFNFSFAQSSCLTNDEKTRSFLTLEIGQGYNEVIRLE
ncbi:hypothetical protein G6F56_003949 [Rhizopus delemar]|nr:hypothetical protein G6F56_003949 [Rhizopus delemar]